MKTLLGLLLVVSWIPIFAADNPSTIVVCVNGTAITDAEIEFAAIQRGISPSERLKAKPKLIDHLIDRQLIRAFLKTQKIEPLADDLELQIANAEKAIKSAGEDPKQFLKKLGYTPERLKTELGLTLAWQVYIRKVVTPTQIKDHFDQHRSEFDGTQLRASQIFLKLPKSASVEEMTEKREKLAVIRQKIVDQNLSFAEAAKRYSEAPSRDHGGDVGLFGWQGKLPATVSRAAFTLKDNEISNPITSPLGIHLIQVTERHPGDFSVEDVRPVILNRLSQQLWKESVDKERATAKIEYVLIELPAGKR